MDETKETSGYFKSKNKIKKLKNRHNRLEKRVVELEDKIDCLELMITNMQKKAAKTTKVKRVSKASSSKKA